MNPCHHGTMAKSKDRDFFVNARRVVELAIGEQMDGGPLDRPTPRSGRALSGKKGGIARAKSLTQEQKRKIAVKAARARWKTLKDD
jgi:hypothetical protein